MNMPMPDNIRMPPPRPTGQLKQAREDKVPDVTTNKVTFTTKEADLIMSSLQADEEVILADKVERGLKKLAMLKDYIQLKQNEDEDN